METKHLETVKLWAVQAEAELPEASIQALARLVAAGRLEYRNGTFSYRLIAPIELANGQTLTAIQIQEPTAGQLAESTRGKKGDMETAVSLMSAISGQPIGVIDRIKQRDFTALAEVLGFFG